MNKGRFGIRRQLHSTKPPGQHNHTSRLMAGGASKSSRSLLKASTNVVIVSFTSQSKLANGVDNLTQLNLPSVDDLNLSNITEQVVYLQYDQLKYGQPILVGKFIQQHGKAEKVAYHIYLSGNHLFLVILNHSQVINKAGKQIQNIVCTSLRYSKGVIGQIS